MILTGERGFEIPIEEWRPIDGAPKYEVSNLGRVRSWFIRRRKNGRADQPTVMSLQIERGSGYNAIHLRTGTQGTTNFRVHRLVARAFLGPRPEGLEIRHLDGDPTNNEVTNLRYGTHTENARDAVIHGTHRNTAKTHCHRGHEFTPENTGWLSDGRRVCRTCKRAYGRAHNPQRLARDRRKREAEATP